MVSPWDGVDKETGGELRYGSHENYFKELIFVQRPDKEVAMERF